MEKRGGKKKKKSKDRVISEARGWKLLSTYCDAMGFSTLSLFHSASHQHELTRITRSQIGPLFLPVRSVLTPTASESPGAAGRCHFIKAMCPGMAMHQSH